VKRHKVRSIDNQFGKKPVKDGYNQSILYFGPALYVRVGLNIEVGLYLETGLYFATRLCFETGLYGKTELFVKTGLYIETGLYFEVGLYIAASQETRPQIGKDIHKDAHYHRGNQVIQEIVMEQMKLNIFKT
jgi:hypothetical protein